MTISWIQYRATYRYIWSVQEVEGAHACLASRCLPGVSQVSPRCLPDVLLVYTMSVEALAVALLMVGANVGPSWGSDSDTITVSLGWRHFLD